MNKNIRQAKNKLTFIFSIIVFIIVLSFGLTYFSVKYYKDVSIEKNDFSNLINLVDTGRLSIENLMTLQNRFNESFIINRGRHNLKIEKIETKFEPKGFINYIFFDSDNNLISSNIKDNIDIMFVSKILDNNVFYNIAQSEGFLVKKFKVIDNNGTFIILKKLRYTFSDYISDMLGFLFLSLIFSIFLYVIGNSFIHKIFVPIEENIKDMKDFIHNAGHELKTPISVIDSNIQLINDMKVYDKHMMYELKKEVNRVNSILEALIKLSDIDVFKDTVKNNLNDLVNEIISDFKFKIEEKKLQLDISIPKHISVLANKNYLYIFLSNIIGNAIKYNKNNGYIKIIYNNGELIIEDSGIGIEEEDLAKIFDRFFKSDKSRNSEGFGIGLSLVKKISDIYNWKIRVKSNKEKGTSFFIKF